MVKGERKMAKKKKQSVDGNSFDQDFDNLKFVQEYSKWKENALGISGESIGVKNIPTLFDFLVVHIIDDNVRANSINRKNGLIGQGGIEGLTAIEDIIEERELRNQDIARIKELAKKIRGYKGMSLDPRLILFTEPKTKRGKKVGTRTLRGHYRTEEYVARRKDGLPAVDSGWYSGTGNPPHWALFGGNSTYASPRGLLEIMEDISDALGKKGEGVKIRDLEIVNLKGKNQVDKMSGIRAIERYFDQLVKKEQFWKGGRLLIDKVRKDFTTQEFKVTPREQSKVRALAGLGTGKDAIAGTIVNFKVTSTALPIIDLVNAALIRAGTNKAPDGYRAWQNKRRTGFDYRKTAKEVYGEDTGRFKPDQKIISKRWAEVLRG
jgi:hypothetical protein